MARAYYNEHDPHAAQWLRNLIAGGHIAPGDVDERSIEDVEPAELLGYRQCHFFAGIGVWSYALRAAGWPDDRPIWTGSCPCQPFSTAGEGAGFDDERHLWPHFFHLIEQVGDIPVVIGEQVASKDADPWIDLVCADMEALGYAFGAVPFPSAGVGAPHIRDRLYWGAIAGAPGGTVVDAIRSGLEGHRRHGHDGHEPGRLAPFAAGPVGAAGATRGLAHAARGGLGELGGALEPGHLRHAHGSGDASGRLADTNGAQPGLAGIAGGEEAARVQPGVDQHGRGALGGMADTDGERRTGDTGEKSRVHEGSIGLGGGGVPADESAGPVNGFWRSADWLFCRDGRWRPVEPGTFPLAHAAPARVGRLRAYGNAINAQAAIEFIRCVMGALA